jgi:hypothetical protein
MLSSSFLKKETVSRLALLVVLCFGLGSLHAEPPAKLHPFSLLGKNLSDSFWGKTTFFHLGAFASTVVGAYVGALKVITARYRPGEHNSADVFFPAGMTASTTSASVPIIPSRN